MLSNLRRVVVTIILAVTCMATTPARASVIDPVDCTRSPTAPECTIQVGVPGAPGDPGGGDGSSGGVSDPNACVTLPVDDPNAPVGGPLPGGWFARHCPIAGGGEAVSAAFWVVFADPAALAQRAVARLVLPLPAIRTNPQTSTDILVRLPVWLWVEPGSWAPVLATAAVGGLSVTATATPTQVLWAPGDGAGVECSGPGTPWRPGLDPWAASPSCGYAYPRSSGGQPGEVYVLRATVTWSVAWRASTGQVGVVPALTTTRTVLVRVAEAQAIN
jgi:hypothetical protein